MLFVPRETSGDEAAELALERLGLLVVFVAVIVVLGFRGEALAAVLAFAEVFVTHVRASDVDLKEKLRLCKAPQLYGYGSTTSISCKVSHLNIGRHCQYLLTTTFQV